MYILSSVYVETVGKKVEQFSELILKCDTNEY